jgi:uncharacterized membrane protein
MTNQLEPAQPQPYTMPRVNTLTPADIRAALMEGLSDFARAPLFGLFFGGIFALAGIIIVLALTVWDKAWMIYPVAIGFPLVGPFAAVGLYEVSRRLEAGLPLIWSEILSVVWAQRLRELSWMAFVMLFVFWIWMYQVRLLIALFLGRMSFSTLEKFLAVVFTTGQGWLFLAVGHVVGAALALVLFSVTVISIPLLMEREVDFVTAMITSVRAVVASPVAMLSWGLIVTLCVIIACLPFFLGLLVILPVLGHATWHLYRRAVVPVD